MSQCILIPGRPGFNALLWWFQGPSTSGSDYSFELDGQPIAPPLVRAVSDELGINAGKAGEVAARTFLAVTEHANEANGTPHWLRVSYLQTGPSNYAYSRTLPDSVDGLTMVLASCFYRANNQLLTAAPLHRNLMGTEQLPHVKMLCGDQIYLDLSRGGWYPHDLEGPWALYDQQWRDPRFVAWMARGGNLCLADDHEFWNNFPSQKRLGVVSFLVNEPPEGMARKMEDAFLIYQAVLNSDPADLLKGNPIVEDHLHCFEFPGDLAPDPLRNQLSMHVLDTRTQRSSPDVVDADAKPQFTDPTWLQDTVTRIAQRNVPCLLVTSQSLLDQKGESESTLANYDNQFSSLWRAVWDNPRPLLLLTGDIHWSRAQEFVSKTTGQKHFEVVSSALARISPGSTKRPGVSSTVKWDNAGVVNALRTADSYAKNTYATLSFSAHDWGLRALVRWWEVNGDGQHVQIDMAAGLLQEASSLFAAQKMEVPIDLRSEHLA